MTTAGANNIVKDWTGAIVVLVLTACLTPLVTLMVTPFGFIVFPGNLIGIIWWSLRTFLRKRKNRNFGDDDDADDPPFIGVRNGFGSQYMSGFIIAVPLSLIVLVVSRAFSSTALLRDAADAMLGSVSDIGNQGRVAILLLLILDLLIVLWGTSSSYAGATSRMLRSWDLSAKGAPAWLMIFAMELFFVTMCIAGPIATMLIGVNGLGSHRLLDILLKAFFIFACVPSFGLGLALFLRGLWMRGLQVQLENLATSTVDAAAQGLVELRGTVRHVDDAPDTDPVLLDTRTQVGPQSEGRPFFIVGDDGTRVLVDLFRSRFRGQESMMLIENPGHDKESLERKLMPGDRVYALGEYTKGDWAGTAVLRPWVPVRTGAFMRALGSFFDRALFMMGVDAASSFSIGRLMEQALSIQFLRGIFIITNAKESRAKRMLFGKWRRSLALGLFYMIGSGALLTAVLSGGIQKFRW